MTGFLVVVQRDVHGECDAIDEDVEVAVHVHLAVSDLRDEDFFLSIHCNWKYVDVGIEL